MFYSVNFDSKVAEHLASIVLVYSEEKQDKIISEQLKQAKAAVFDKKSLLIIVADNSSFSEISVPNAAVIIKTEEELNESFRKKDSDALQILKKGIVLHGEELIVKAIRNSMPRF